MRVPLIEPAAVIRSPLAVAWLLLPLAAAVVAGRQTPAVARAFAFVQPWVQFSRGDQATLAEGGVVAEALQVASDEVAGVGAVRVDISGDELLDLVAKLEALRAAPEVQAAERFSKPPRLSDLDALTLDDRDLDAIQSCRPGSCDVKLSDDAIARLKALATGPDWKQKVQEGFRALVLDRVRTYLSDGLGALPAHHDHSDPVAPGAAFVYLLDRAPFLARRLPGLTRYLKGPPADPPPGVDWFIYWSKEKFGDKNIVRVVQLALLTPAPGEGLPDAVIVGKQILATHYLDAFLDVTAIVPAGGGSPRYLLYYNRSRVDFLGGFFGPFKRAIAGGHVRDDLKTLLERLRLRLEARKNGV
jgi:hypothetical protein